MIDYSHNARRIVVKQTIKLYLKYSKKNDAVKQW